MSHFSASTPYVNATDDKGKQLFNPWERGASKTRTHSVARAVPKRVKEAMQPGPAKVIDYGVSGEGPKVEVVKTGFERPAYLW